MGHLEGRQQLVGGFLNGSKAGLSQLRVHRVVAEHDQHEPGPLHGLDLLVEGDGGQGRLVQGLLRALDQQGHAIGEVELLQDRRHEAGGTREGFSDWVERWMSVEHAERLSRLGPERLLWLQGKARADSWRPELLGALGRVELEAPPNRTELMVGGSGARCLGSLGAGQVDRWGRFNSTQLEDGTLLVGSGTAGNFSSKSVGL